MGELSRALDTPRSASRLPSGSTGSHSRVAEAPVLSPPGGPADGGAQSCRFPQARFPLGVAAPSTVLLVGLFVCAAGLAVRAVAPSFGPAPVLSSPSGVEDWWGLASAAGLAAVAVLAFVVLRAAVVGPVRRLRDDITGIASGELPGVPRRSRVREIERIARVLPPREGRTGIAGTKSRRAVMPMGLSLVAVLILVLSWLVTGITFAGNAAVADERAVIEQSRRDVDLAAQQLHRSLGGGLAQLQGVAASATGDNAGGLIENFFAEQRLFRSIYLIDSGGLVTHAAGQARGASGRPDPSAPPRLEQANTSGPEPIVVGSAPLPGRTGTLVAEYDPRALNEVLRRPGIPTLVVDAAQRTIFSSSGYRAFEELDDPMRRAVVGGAQNDQPAVTIDNQDGHPFAVAAQHVEVTGPAAALQWVIVQDQRANAAFTQTYDQRIFLVVAGAVTALTLLVLAWTTVVTVQPLRRLAAHLVDTPSGPAPVQHLDETGAIAAGANHCVRTRPASPSCQLGDTRS